VPSRDGTLYIFIDESGNLDLGPRGTRHFVMAALSTFSPAQAASGIHELKYRLLASGSDLPAFHASEDRQWVRDLFLPVVNQLPESRGHVVFGSKEELKEDLSNSEAFIAAFGRSVVELALAEVHAGDLEGVVVIFDQVLPTRRRGALTAAVKSHLKRLGCPYGLFFHRMSTDALGQAADYLAWAKYVELERGEPRPWNELRAGLRPMATLFGSGNQGNRTGTGDRPD
jgi:hypothetical protein